MFGDNPVYVAVRSDALVIGVGAGALDAVKAALKAKPGLAPPVSYEAELAGLLSVLPKDEAASKAAEKAFGKGSPGRFRLSTSTNRTRSGIRNRWCSGSGLFPSGKSLALT